MKTNKRKARSISAKQWERYRRMQYHAQEMHRREWDYGCGFEQDPKWLEHYRALGMLVGYVKE